MLAELQASQLDKLVRGQAQPGPIHTDLPVSEAGELALTPAGVVSSVYGSLRFMTPIGETPLAGGNAVLCVDREVLEIANRLARDEYQAMMQASAWGNLPILNEWKRKYPDRDPVDVHRRLWHAELLCPGGGKYMWNEKCGTMESTVYGHPGDPKQGPPAPPVLSSFRKADFGLTFENQGLRARATLK